MITPFFEPPSLRNCDVIGEFKVPIEPQNKIELSSVQMEQQE